MFRIVLIGGILFAASAAASWFLLPRFLAEEPRAEATEGADGLSEPLPPPPADMLPVAVRPEPMTPEEVLRHAASLRARQESLDARERLVEQRESRWKLIEIDIRGERQEWEALREELAADAVAVDGVQCRATRT